MPVGSPEQMHQARGRKGRTKELGSCGIQDKAVDTFPLSYNGLHSTCGWQSLAGSGATLTQVPRAGSGGLWSWGLPLQQLEPGQDCKRVDGILAEAPLLSPHLHASFAVGTLMPHA